MDAWTAAITAFLGISVNGSGGVAEIVLAAVSMAAVRTACVVGRPAPP